MQKLRKPVTSVTSHSCADISPCTTVAHNKHGTILPLVLTAQVLPTGVGREGLQGC